MSKTKDIGEPSKQRRKELLWQARSLLKIPVTIRELECGLLQLLGNSSSVTAKILGIAKRTVDYYLMSLRIKSDCDSKRALNRFLQQRMEIRFVLGDES